MKKGRLIISVAIALGLSLVGCGSRIEPAPSDNVTELEATPAESTQIISEPSSEVPETDTVSVVGPYGEISVTVPENWSAEAAPVDSNRMMYGLYGLILKPQSLSSGQIELFCTDSFGVCGTGLSEEDTTLAGNTVHVGTFDDHAHWDFIDLPVRDTYFLLKVKQKWRQIGNGFMVSFPREHIGLQNQLLM